LKSVELLLSNSDLVGFLKETLARDASFRFSVKGSSMYPFIRDGDVVLVSPPRRSIAFGAPVALANPRTGQFVIHRVVGRRKDRYLIKGDNIPHPDGWMAREDILGIVSDIERSGRRATFGLGPERALIAILSRAGLLPAIFFLWNLIPRSIRKLLK
jgi:signal peptidase I